MYLPEVYIYYLQMEVTYNNQIKEIHSETLVSDFVLSQIGDKQNGIAMAINEVIIPKTEWSKTYIKSNDSLLIIKATQGG